MALLHGIMQVRGPKGQVTRLRDVDGSETKLFGSFRSRSPGLTVADHMTAQRLLCGDGESTRFADHRDCPNLLVSAHRCMLTGSFIIRKPICVDSFYGVLPTNLLQRSSPEPATDWY